MRSVRPPIYDTGASLWSGELDVDGRDWFAKPFYTATGKPSALRQLRLVEDWSRFDLDALSDWPDEVAYELSRMRMFAPERLDAIRVQLVKRIGCSGESAKVRSFVFLTRFAIKRI